MKPAAAILLMGILLFNWFGYRLLTLYLQEKASSELTEELSGNKYSDEELISLKVPVTHLSYYHNSKEFEWVDGAIEIGGIEYKYVKRRIYQDTLEVMCVPDQAAIQLKMVRNEFFRFANDLHRPGQGKRQGANTSVSKPFSPDYCSSTGAFQFKYLSFSFKRPPCTDIPPICSIYSLVPEHPPRANA